MNRWDRPGVPHKGWACVDVIDLADEHGGSGFYEQCTMCGQEEIRYVHIMTHPEYADQRVGCICAGKMSEDYIGARAREKALRNKASRKSKWLTREWRVSANGNEYLNLKGRNLGIFQKDGKWVARIEDKFSKRRFVTEQEAKLHLFEAYNGDWEEL